MRSAREAEAAERFGTADLRSRLGEAVQTTRERIETDAQSRPLRTILISVGAGLLVGFLLGLGRKRSSD
jgi:ElaB/YqjD/DUF883 family membrane-anchored ribosome-binding protein